MRDLLFDPGAECGGARDALPDLLHGRLADEARARAEAHVAACPACAAELALLRSARGAVAAGAPRVDVAAIAAAVRAATIHAPETAPVPAPVRTARPVAPPPAVTRLARWRGTRRLRALAATVLVALGTGTAVYGWSTRERVPSASAGAPGVVVAGSGVEAARGSAATPQPGGVALAAADPALGARFDDLTDEELQAVIAEIDGPDAALVSFEPEPATPAVTTAGEDS